MRSSWVLAGLVLLALVFGGASAYEKCPNCGLGEGVDPCNCGGTVVKAAKLHKPSLVASPEAINYALKYQEANGVYGQPIPGYGAPVTAYGAHAYGAHSAHAYGAPCKNKAPFVDVLDHESRYEIGDGGKTYEELQQLLYRKPGTSVAPLFKPVGDLGHPDRMGKYFGSQYAAAGPHKIVGVTPAYPGKTPCKCPPPAAPKVYGTPSTSYAPAPAYGAPAYAAPAAYAPAAYPKPAYGAAQPAYAAPKSYGAPHHAYPAPKPYEAHQPRPAYHAPKPYGHPASYSAPSAYPAHKPQAYGPHPTAYSAPAHQAPKPYAPPSPAYSAPKPYAPASPAYSAPKPYAPASPAYSAPKPYGPHPAPYAAPAAYSPAPKAYAPAYPAPAYPAPASYAAPAPAMHKPAYPAPPTVYSSTSAAYPAAAAPAYAMAAPAKPAYSKTAYSATSHYGHDDDDEGMPWFGYVHTIHNPYYCPRQFLY